MSSVNLQLEKEENKDGELGKERQEVVEGDIPKQGIGVFTGRKRGICYRYLRSGTCKFGEDCHFSHDIDRDHRKPKVQKKPRRKVTEDSKEIASSNLAEQENEDGELRRPENKVSRGRALYTDDNVPVCKFFERDGNCWNGPRCRFLHPEEFKRSNWRKNQREIRKGTTKIQDSENTDTREVREGKNEGQIKVRDERKEGQIKRRRRICRDFKSGHCDYGTDCRFWHPPDLLDVEAVYDEGQNKAQNEKRYSRQSPRNRPLARQANFMLESLTPEDVAKLRSTEVDQLKKRFPAAEIDDDKYSYIFAPTEPDWPYDVKDVPMTVFIPAAYPQKMLRVYVLEDDDLPDIVGRQIGKASLEWIQTRFERLKNSGKVELMFRPYLKWLDKNLEDLFTEGLKKYKLELEAYAAGLEFIPACRLKEQLGSHSDSDDGDEQNKENADDDNEDVSQDDEECEDDEIAEGVDNLKLGDHEAVTDLNQKREGTEVKLLHLQLKESVASLMMTHIQVVIKCERCLNTTDISTPADRSNLVKCPRCANEQVLVFHSALMHPYSSVAGFLDLNGCVAQDVILVNCGMQAGCLSCDKQIELLGIAPGQLSDSWCRGCHSKLQIAVESARLTVLKSNTAKLDASDVHVIKLKNIGRVRDPAIQPGKPLPNEGTCKHYKKSFRWLRFPCCGKAYPCDLCHDTKEMDHEMKYANRMICGFCCKEQSYSLEKPCIACKSSLTHKSTTHWEGGKGCRDKTRMSKDDPKKYANTNKTISRKSQDKKTPKSKAKSAS